MSPMCRGHMRARKLPLVIHVNHSDGPRLVLFEQELPGYACSARRSSSIRPNWSMSSLQLDWALGVNTSCSEQIDRRTWRRSCVGEAQLPDIRDHMADFKKYLKVDVTPAHLER